MTVAVNIDVMRYRLRQFDFTGLLVDELGWDHYRASVPPVVVDGVAYAVRAVAQKCGLVVFECAPGTGGCIPSAPIRRRIEKQVAKWAIEHLVVFVDADRTTQVWQWVKRRSDGPDLVRHQTLYPSSSGDLLLEKLRQMVFDLGEEDRLTIIDAAERVRRAFDVEKVTKKFYERFRAEHKRFLSFIEGISRHADREWYASLMLNRLMFVYFIQRKGFLDGGDYNYLRNRLERVRKTAGKDQFQSFYRLFLLRLFHEGLSKPQGEHSHELVSLLGKVPYLNGGLFDVHDLERHNPDIKIPDKAFVEVFDFFDEFDWHLDSRPSVSGNEINPDVLGYIFERYINQREMGAYYTKEDITGYICRNTIVPFLLTEVAKVCPSTFVENGLAWSILAEEPDAYLPTALRHGISFDQNLMRTFREDRPLPDHIMAGSPAASQRMPWNNLATDDYALPTETWREHVARRKRYTDIRAKLRGSEARDVADLVAWNVDLERFARDIILQSGDIDVVMAFWVALQRVSVLDPTCGSGAFLFAALNILHDLYDACLEAMAGLLDDAKRTHVAPQGKLKEAADVIAGIAHHRSRSYAILKSVMVNNLYGVDLMEEATEICKLRLFLKLVAQVNKGDALEPLPDVDFNIRAGNALIGFGSLDEVRKAASQDSRGQKKILYGEDADAIAKIEARAKDADVAFQEYRRLQSGDIRSAVLYAAKDRLKTALNALETELDQRLANASGIRRADVDTWRATAQPFHWCVDFYGVMAGGGFDVIVGNPPYVVYPSKNVPYALESFGYGTLTTKNLYSFVFERSMKLAKEKSPVGLIVQLTSMSSEKMPPLQQRLIDRGTLFAMSFPRRPQSVFEGVEMPVAILLSMPGYARGITTSDISRFYAEERLNFIGRMSTCEHSVVLHGHRIAKFGHAVEKDIYVKVSKKRHSVASLVSRTPKASVYYQEACRYWLKAMDRTPRFLRNGEAMEPPHGRKIGFASKEAAAFVAGLLNSSLFYWWYSAFSDCEHVNDALVRTFPIPEAWATVDWRRLTDALIDDLEANAVNKTIRTKQGHVIEYDEISASGSKPLIDAVDIQLGDLYGFTADELDYIINYDIKYRSGGAATDELPDADVA